MENNTLFDLPQEEVVSKKANIGIKGFTARQLKMIQWYCKQNNVKPALSNPPYQMNFTDLSTGLEKTTTMTNILDAFNVWNKEDQKRRAQERALEKAQRERR